MPQVQFDHFVRRFKFQHYFLLNQILLLLISNQFVFGQVDSLPLSDTTLNSKTKEKKKKDKATFSYTDIKKHSPKKAVIFALTLPGAGQIYNKKYWKLPIVYAGFGGLGYLALTNGIKYNCYRKSYLAMVDDDPFSINTCDPSLSTSEMKILRNSYLQNFENSLLGLAGFYILTVVDAFVDAHLMNFDISNDLSISVKPTFDVRGLSMPKFNQLQDFSLETFSFDGISARLGLKFSIYQKHETISKYYF
jgi:hypothetical protein